MGELCSVSLATTAVSYMTNGEGDDGPGCGDIKERRKIEVEGPPEWY